MNDIEAGDIVWIKSGAKSCQADYKEGSTGTPKMTVEILSGVGSEKKASCVWWNGFEYKRDSFYVASLIKVERAR